MATPKKTVAPGACAAVHSNHPASDIQPQE